MSKKKQTKEMRHVIGFILCLLFIAVVTLKYYGNGTDSVSFTNLQNSGGVIYADKTAAVASVEVLNQEPDTWKASIKLGNCLCFLRYENDPTKPEKDTYVFKRDMPVQCVLKCTEGEYWGYIIHRSGSSTEIQVDLPYQDLNLLSVYIPFDKVNDIRVGVDYPSQYVTNNYIYYSDAFYDWYGGSMHYIGHYPGVYACDCRTPSAYYINMGYLLPPPSNGKYPDWYCLNVPYTIQYPRSPPPEPITISEFQIQQIEDGNYNKIQVSFNTNVPTVVEYKLEGHTKYTETEFKTNNHTYTYTVTPYTDTNYEIIVTNTNSETVTKTGTFRTYGEEICNDGLDNDGDGLIDWDDTQDCCKITIQKISENVKKDRWDAVFNITGNVTVKIEYQKGEGSTTLQQVSGVGTEYPISLTNLDHDSLYNYIVYAVDIDNPSIVEEYRGSFTTLSEEVSKWIEITGKETTSSSFKITFKILESSFSGLKFEYKKENESPREITPKKWGDEYIVEGKVSSGNYEYIISIEVSGETKTYEDVFTIEALPTPTTIPPSTIPTVPSTTTPQTPTEGDKFHILGGVILIGVVILIIIMKRRGM